jgi:hypothetical protein
MSSCPPIGAGTVVVIAHLRRERVFYSGIGNTKEETTFGYQVAPSFAFQRIG